MTTSSRSSAAGRPSRRHGEGEAGFGGACVDCAAARFPVTRWTWASQSLIVARPEEADFTRIRL